MMEMISGKFYGTSEAIREEILEPEDETPHTLKFSKRPNVLQIGLTTASDVGRFPERLSYENLFQQGNC